MNFTAIELIVEGERATLTLNRPTNGNRLTIMMIDEMLQVCRYLEDKTDCRFLVLRGAGKDFCAGIDLLDFASDTKPDVHGFSRWEKLVRALERLPLITIAILHGECAGGGLHIPLACDARVAVNDAFFHFNEAPLGFLPGMALFRLAKFVGLGRARRMALTGRHVDAVEAEHIGLVDHICTANVLEQMLSTVMAEFGRPDRVTIELIRRLLDESFEMCYEDYLGGFLAAQYRAIQGSTFCDNLRRAHERSQRG